jgi:hypothetical protein
MLFSFVVGSIVTFGGLTLFNSIFDNDSVKVEKEVTVVDNNEICDPLSYDTCEDITDLNGTVLIKINNLESAYQMSLYRIGEEDAIGLSMVLKNNKVYYRPCEKNNNGDRTNPCVEEYASASCGVNTNSIYDEFYIENLLEGNYELYITTFDNSYQIVKESEILRESLSDFPEINEIYAKIYTVDFKNAFSPISRDSSNTSREGYICLPLLEDTKYIAQWKIKFKFNGKYYYFEIQNGENNTTGSQDIFEIESGSPIGEIEGEQYNVYIEDENQIKKVYVPFGDIDYFVIAMYACDGSYRELADDGSYYINYDELNTEIYFNALEDKGKEPVSGHLIRNCLSDGSNDIETIIDKQWYLNDKLVDLPTIVDSRLNPDPILTMLIMDMSLVCQDSLFGRQSSLYGYGNEVSHNIVGTDPCSTINKISFYLKEKITKEDGTINFKRIEEDNMVYNGHIESDSTSRDVYLNNDIPNLTINNGEYINDENGPDFQNFIFPTYIHGDAYYWSRLNDFSKTIYVDGVGPVISSSLNVNDGINYNKIKDYEIEF